jgi:protein-tyrosine phosphatase
VIDLHCHILPGIDDGPATVEQSLALARAAHAAGTRTIVATPHVSWRYPNDAPTIARLADELNERLAAEGVALQVCAGAEIAMTRVEDLGPAELASLALGGGSWLLIEPPFTPVVTGLELVVGQLRSQGHGVVLAHPERCPAFHREPHILHALIEGGALTSITAGSLTGRFGGQVRRFSMSLVAQGLAHNVASDAHDVRGRPPSIAAELDRAGLGEWTEWLTRSVPKAILSGAEIPPRPRIAQRPRRRLPFAGWRRR